MGKKTMLLKNECTIEEVIQESDISILMNFIKVKTKLGDMEKYRDEVFHKIIAISGNGDRDRAKRLLEQANANMKEYSIDLEGANYLNLLDEEVKTREVVDLTKFELSESELELLESEIIKDEVRKAKKREWRKKQYAPIKEKNEKLRGMRVELAKEYYEKGYTQEEISGVLNCSVRTVQRYLKTK